MLHTENNNSDIECKEQLAVPKFIFQDNPNPLFRMYQFPLLSGEECDIIVDEAEKDIQNCLHCQYAPFRAVPINRLKKGKEIIHRLLESRIYSQIEKLYNVKNPHSFSLHEASSIVCYNAVLHQRRDGDKKIVTHRDPSLFSCNILLNNPDQFEGGGTHFMTLDKTIENKKGHTILHCGKLRHKGNIITKGKRYVLVAFINLESESVLSMSQYELLSYLNDIELVKTIYN